MEKKNEVEIRFREYDMGKKKKQDKYFNQNLQVSSSKCNQSTAKYSLEWAMEKTDSIWENKQIQKKRKQQKEELFGSKKLYPTPVGTFSVPFSIESVCNLKKKKWD